MYQLQIYLFLYLLSSILFLLQDLCIDICNIVLTCQLLQVSSTSLVTGRAFYLASLLLTCNNNKNEMLTSILVLYI